jgi:hypothetical protein
MGLCQPDQRGKLMLPVSSRGLEELYEAQPSPFIIFHHQITSTVHFLVPWHFDDSHNLGVLLSII